MSDYKESIRKAIERNYERNSVDENYSKRTNEKPEKKVVSQILQWADKYGMDLSTIDSRATWNEYTKSYTGRTTSEVMPDLVGDSNGWACYIEVKATGCRSRLSKPQYEFLLRKIENGAFACCADSVEYLENLFVKASELCPKDRKIMLKCQLPLPYEKKSSFTGQF